MTRLITLTAAALLALGILAGPAMASGADRTTSDAPSTARNGDDDSGGDDDSVTATERRKASAAARSAVGGGRVVSVESSKSGTQYEVHVRKDGVLYEVKLSKTFRVLKKERNPS